MFNTGHNQDNSRNSLETAIHCTDEEGMTQQQFKDETDINEIVRRFGLTGQMPDNVNMPMSGDFTGINDYQTALNLILAADTEFMRVPAETRARFNNDPQKLMTFLDDPNNRDEAIKLGLVPKPAEKTRTTIDAIDELHGTMTAAQSAPNKGKNT